MSDFGELCPLFSTGVFNEVTFPAINLTAVTACGNALLGTLTFTKEGAFSFGRTVIVTGAFIRRTAANGSQAILNLNKHASQLAVGSTIGSLVVSTTLCGMEVYTWVPMTVATGITVTSNEVLGLTITTGFVSGAGTYDLIVRYKEK
jgi:hypothetical protein